MAHDCVIETLLWDTEAQQQVLSRGSFGSEVGVADKRKSRRVDAYIGNQRCVVLQKGRENQPRRNRWLFAPCTTIQEYK
jgi:hypothetical protein